MTSTQSMTQAIGQASHVMAAFNKQMNLPEINQMLQDFNKQNQRMEMTEEMMGDAMDMAFENEEDLEATDQVVDQVLSEIGVEVGGALEHGPAQRLPARPQVEEQKQDFGELESRFNALR